ncbi:TonB-dependent receptor domain-containing protein [Pontibacter sp. MBLB2868]|uniref:TonB-dependent receptor domain-containing protein n=1 Tax=Pontibacter sp. MBLB2868 TaxID=3451555 RepID=UPI003F75551F
MKRNIILTICLFTMMTGNVLAQLTGSLLDANGEPLGYANVAVLQAKDSTVVTGAITGPDGNFMIATPVEGVYLLRLSALGYTTNYVVPFQVSSSNRRRDFGRLTLHEDTKLLSEVTIKALRPTIVVEADKLVVSVEGTALAAGSTAYGVLEKSPGVWVDQEGNIKLNGKAGVRVLIDGRPSYLSGKELQSMLEAMPAEDVKNIEVIANPSAKYEAAGSAGVINIKLKQNTHQGMNGSVYGGYQYNKASGYNAGANLNYKKGDWNSFVSADVAERPRLREGVMIREFHEAGANARFHQLRNEHMTTNSPSLRLGTDYDLNDRHSVGAVAHLSHSTTDRAFYSVTDMDDRAKGAHTLVEASNFNDITNSSHAINLHYNGLLDTTGASLAVNLDYIQLDNNNEARYANRFLDVNTNTRRDELLKTYNPGYYDIYSTNVDFGAKVHRSTKLELGLKASHVVSGNQLSFYVADPEQEDLRELDKDRSNHYRYTESILAAYANVSIHIDDNWSMQTGLRGEQTFGKGKPIGGGEAIAKHYLDFFPSFFLTQKVSSSYKITYNYSRRIDRPNYRTLNPFIFYQDPYSWAEGNPDLRPQYTNSFQLIQTLQNTYNLVLGYSYTKDFFAEVPQQNSENNTTIYQERNIDKAENFSATLVAPVKLLKGWDVSNNLVAGYQRNNILLQDKELKNEQFTVTAQSTHNVLLPLGLQLQATAGYSSPSTYGVYIFKTQWWLDAGLKKSLLDDKLDLTLGATDIFRTSKARGDASYNGNVFSFVNYFMVQSIKLNLRYNFQRGQSFKSKSKSTRLEELKRAGGQ